MDDKTLNELLRRLNEMRANLQRRLLRGNFAIVSLSVGASDYGNAWGVRLAVLGVHVEICTTRFNYLYVQLSTWPWNGWSEAWAWFPYRGGKRWFQR